MEKYKNRKVYWNIGGIILAGVILFVVFSIYTAKTEYKTRQITLGDKTFSAEIADTPYLQEKGLSGRTSIANDYAMLFVFSKPDTYKFWMKDMNFPIDIIWLSPEQPTSAKASVRQGKIIYIEKNLSPSTYPQAFGPTDPSQYVIEVASGISEHLGLSIDQIVQFNF